METVEDEKTEPAYKIQEMMLQEFDGRQVRVFRCIAHKVLWMMTRHSCFPFIDTDAVCSIHLKLSIGNCECEKSFKVKL